MTATRDPAEQHQHHLDALLGRAVQALGVDPLEIGEDGLTALRDRLDQPDAGDLLATLEAGANRA